MSDQLEKISFKEFIKDFNGEVNYLKQKWKVILLVGLMLGAIGLVYALYSKPNYTASLSFVLSSDGKGGSSLLGLASQFGIDMSGTSGSNDMFSSDNIITLLSSRKMVQKALFKKTVDNKLLINIAADELGLLKKWEKKQYLRPFLPFPDNVDAMKPTQDSLARAVFEIVSKKLLSVSKPDKKQGIFLVNVNSSNEAFSIYLAKYIVDETTQFYIATKTKVAKQNLDMIQREADSLQHLLHGTITSTASMIDASFNLNPAYQIQRSGVQQNQVQSTVLSTAYGEVVKNVEIAKVTLQKETPLFQVIDEPTLPLVRTTVSKSKAIAIGFILGVILTSLFIVIKRIYNSYLI